MLMKTLKNEGHTTEEAEDGLLAVGMVKDKGLTTFDAILMDFVMVCPVLFLSHLPSYIIYTYTVVSHIPWSLSCFVLSFQPVMDGPSATKAIRELGYKGPIIGCTGNTLDMDVQRFKECGCDHVMGKPFRMDQFAQVFYFLFLFVCCF